MSVVGDAWVHVRPELSGFPGELTEKVSAAVKGSAEETKGATAEMSAAWDRLEAAEARAAAGAESAAAAAQRLTLAQEEAAAAARAQTEVLIGSDTAATRAAAAQANLAAAEERAGLAAQAAAAKQAQVVEAQGAAAASAARVTAEAERSGGALNVMAGIGQKVAIGVAAGLGIAGAASVKMAVDFDTSQRQMQAQGGFTEAQAADIGKAFLATGGQVTFSAQQMLDAFGPVAGQLNELAGHTLSAKEALEFERNAVNLAEASHADLKSTTANLANVMQAFGIDVAHAADAADTLQNASRLTNVPMDQLSLGVDRLHAKLGPLSPSLDDTATLITALSEAGLRGTKAVQGVIPAMDNLTASSGKGHDELAALGVTVRNTEGGFIGMSGTIAALAPKLAAMSPNERQRAEVELFGNAWAYFDKIIMAGSDHYDQLSATIGKAGSAEKAAEVNTSSLRGESEKFLAGAKDIGVELGQFLVPILKTLVSGLNDGARFFKENEAAALAVGSAIGALASVFIGAFLIVKLQALIAMLGSAKAAMVAFGDTSLVEAALSRVAALFGLVGTGATSAAAGFAMLGGGTGAALLGLGALTIAAGTYVGAQQSINDSNKNNEASFKQWAGALPHGSFDEVTASLHTLNGKLGENQTSWLQDAQAMAGVTDQTTDTARAVQSGVGPVRDSFQKISDATKQVAHDMGLTNEQAFALLRGLNVDWSKTSVQDAVDKLRQSLAGTAAETHTSADALQGLSAIAAQTGQSVKDLSAAEDKAGKSAADAFTKATDVVSAFSGKLTSAGDIRKWYADQTKLADTFSADIQKAMTMHLDPGLISRLLTAGPQQAGPLLHALVTNTNADFAKMVNDSEAKFREMSAAAAEMGRLTQRAISGATQQWSLDLSTAMDASQRIMAQGGDKSVKGLTNALHVGTRDLARTLGEYGITFELSAADQERIAGAGGAKAAEQIAAKLREGRPLSVEELALFEKAFSDNANAAAGHGADAGNNFAGQARQRLSDQFGAFSQQVLAYDNALNQGLSPIAAAVSASGSLQPITIPGLLGNAQPKAMGGLVDRPGLFIAGEGGHAETVISHNPAYRGANVGHWTDAGKALGIPGFAEGGFTDPSQVPRPPALTPAFGVIDQSFGVQGQHLLGREYDAVVGKVAAEVAARAAAAASAGAGRAGPAPDVSGVAAFVRSAAAARGWTGAEWDALYQLEMMEAGFDPFAANPTSNARGIAQKITGWSADYQPGNVPQQTAWLLDYIAGRYGDPLGALGHEQAFHWYDNGGWWPHGTLGMNTSGQPELVLPGNIGQSIFGLITQLAATPPTAAGGGTIGNIDASVHLNGPADAQAVATIADMQTQLVELIRKVVAEGNQATISELAARGVRAPARIPGGG